MASNREYAYYIRGNKVAIVEKGLGAGVCSLSGYGTQTACEDAGGTWTENATGNTDGEYISPINSIADGLEIEYTYSPSYWINDISDTQAITGYEEDSNGFLKVTGSGMSTDTAVDYIVIRGSDKLNGLRKVTTRNASYWILTTKYNGDAVTETMTAYQDIDVLNDESDELPISEYLSKAVVYYLKAKIAEDIGNFDLKNVMMREFYRIVEKNDNTKIHTIRKVASHSAAIR